MEEMGREEKKSSFSTIFKRKRLHLRSNKGKLWRQSVGTDSWRRARVSLHQMHTSPERNYITRKPAFPFHCLLYVQLLFSATCSNSYQTMQREYKRLFRGSSLPCSLCGISLYFQTCLGVAEVVQFISIYMKKEGEEEEDFLISFIFIFLF